MEKWKQQLSRLQEGVFKDELRFARNQLLELPIEEQPTEEQIMEFVNECIQKDFKEIFVYWNKTLRHSEANTK